MKVILKVTIPKVGKEGQVVTVKDGFARNYLFPRQFATVANKAQLQILDRRNAKIAQALASTVAAAEDLKSKINGLELRIQGKSGKESTKLFGAVTSQDIADALLAQHKVTVEKKQVALVEPIKRLGNFRIQLDLHRDVDAFVNLTVFDPEHPLEPVAAPVAEEAAAPVEAEAPSTEEAPASEEAVEA